LSEFADKKWPPDPSFPRWQNKWEYLIGQPERTGKRKWNSALVN